ncbi:hypothetical protein MBLNU230_g7777t1 [Neophaeotheca triangularis]
MPMQPNYPMSMAVRNTMATHRQNMGAPNNRKYMEESYGTQFLNTHVAGWREPLETTELPSTMVIAGPSQSTDITDSDEEEQLEDDDGDVDEDYDPAPERSTHKRATKKPTPATNSSKKGKGKQPRRRPGDDEDDEDHAPSSRSGAMNNPAAAENLNAASWDDYEKLVALQVLRDNSSKTGQQRAAIFNAAIAGTTRPDGTTRGQRSYQSYRQCVKKLGRKGVTVESLAEEEEEG